MPVGRPKTGRPKSGSDRCCRNHKLCIRISKEDLDKLERVCSFFGITKTDYIITKIGDGIEDIRRVLNAKNR